MTAAEQEDAEYREFSLLARITYFFAAAPDEELTAEDIALKTGRDISFVRHTLGTLRADGVLAEIRSPGRTAIRYTPTPEARIAMLHPLSHRDGTPTPQPANLGRPQP